MLPLQDKAVEIMNRYCSPQRKYIFPILDNRERTSRQIKNRIYDVLANVNGHLDDIGKELGIEKFQLCGTIFIRNSIEAFRCQYLYYQQELGAQFKASDTDISG